MPGKLFGKALLFAGLATLAGIQRVHASAINTESLCGNPSYCVYYNEAAFIGAVGQNPLGLENFAGPSFPAGNYCSNGHNCFVGDSGGLSITGALPSVGSGPVGGGINVSDPSHLDLTFPQNSTYYYGFRYSIAGIPSNDVQVGQNGVGAFSNLPDSGFFGIVSSTPLNMAEPGVALEPISGPGMTYVDDVRFATGPGAPGGPPVFSDSTTGCGPGKVCWFWYAVAAAYGLYVDPSGANAYTYQTLDGSLFTSVGGFPTGFSSPFDISSGGTDFGLFNPGQTLTFPGGGVSQFTISGINPEVDGSSPSAFPIQIALNTATANIEATAFEEPTTSSPEPSSFLFCVAGLAVVGWRMNALRKRSHLEKP